MQELDEYDKLLLRLLQQNNRLTHTRDMAHFEEFSKKHLMDNPNLKHFYTHVVMDKVKVSYGITI